MNIKQLSYCLVCFVMLSSCKQWKSLTARDNSTTPRVEKKKSNKEVVFLDNISVRAGEEVTSKHTSNGNTRVINKNPQSVYKAAPSLTSGDIERADFLQLKYAIVLDATVENLTNVSMLKAIDDWWGTRYCMGGSTKSCIDCSAFTQTVMSDVYNVNLPRTAQEQYNSSEHIGLEQMEEGDLVFFKTSGRAISHVGIYLLNNKFVHAATSGGVMVSDLNDSYWQSRFRGAGRVRSSVDAKP
jgi:cell wall-associated NlpC family hydrolase